jgi:hypothetical protein
MLLIQNLKCYRKEFKIIFMLSSKESAQLIDEQYSKILFFCIIMYVPPAAVREELLDVLFLIVYSIMRYGGAGSNPP